ncbi:hypothetical protein JW710_00200 [Candidatus Dojkabacteria bacterium]|nr:hypothetical protein [Candidatus Dojkabacteria bacterium]
MQLYKFSKSDDSSILAYDLFKLLGMSAVDQKEKDEYMELLEKLVLEYYLQEKVGRSLKPKQLEDLMEKYPPTNTKNVEALLEEIGEALPNAEDLFVDANREVKARVVKEQYEAKRLKYMRLMKEARNVDQMKDYQSRISNCTKTLQNIDEEKWNLVGEYVTT